MRVALGLLVQRSYFVAEARSGQSTRYAIHARFFSPVESSEAEDTPSQNGAGSSGDAPSQNGKGGYSQNGKGGLPEMGRGGIPVSGRESPDNEHRKKNTGDSNTGEERSARESDPHPSLFPIEKTPRPKKASKSLTVSAIDAAFDDTYRHYPRHKAEGAARRAYHKAIRAGADPEEIKLAVLRYPEQREREEPDPVKRETYTPHFSTWLKDKRWKDAPPAASAPGAASRGGARLSPLEMAFANFIEDDNGE